MWEDRHWHGTLPLRLYDPTTRRRRATEDDEMNKPHTKSAPALVGLTLGTILVSASGGAAQTVLVTPPPVIGLPPPPPVNAFDAISFPGSPVVTTWTGPQAFGGYLQPQDQPVVGHYVSLPPATGAPDPGSAAPARSWVRVREAFRHLISAISDYIVKPIRTLAGNVWDRIRRPPSEHRCDVVGQREGRSGGGVSFGTFYPWWPPSVPVPQPFPWAVFHPDCYPFGARTDGRTSGDPDDEKETGDEPPSETADGRPAAAAAASAPPQTAPAVTSRIVGFRPSGEAPASGSKVRELLTAAALRMVQMPRHRVCTPSCMSFPICFGAACSSFRSCTAVCW
jgi:hypothetical protein